MMKNESGRSMVEMLGVLAIIGVLSVGGIAGYTMAMNKYRANEIAKNYISCGASPRAAQAIYKTAKAKALLEGRYNVSFEDVESVALPALRHRITLSFEALAEGITTHQIVKKIIDIIPKE